MFTVGHTRFLLRLRAGLEEWGGLEHEEQEWGAGTYDTHV